MPPCSSSTRESDVTAQPLAAPATDPYTAFRDELVAHGLLIATGVPGLFGRGAAFERVIERFDDCVTRAGAADQPEIVRFPPLLNRREFERSEYLKSFPNLCGSVHSFDGDDADHRALLHAVEQGADWTGGLAPTEVVLTPAACYPVYPAAAGTLPAEGRLFDVFSYCFRHEPSADPARMQMFRMHEYVRLGEPDEVRRFRDVWLERSLALLHAVGLDVRAVVANDPFFGRAGRMLASNQRERSLKFELVVPICSTEKPTAVVSCNYHQDHFGTLFGIATAAGAPAHTACVGFGMERIALALFRRHGLSTERWPESVRVTLGL
ncbi:MAG: amino acid--[acyl-carrier-protein] ligase [Gemmatimonadota bacterium]